MKRASNDAIPLVRRFHRENAARLRRSPRQRRTAANETASRSKRAASKSPHRANPCISIVFLEPRKTGACGAEARMHGLGTLTRGTQRILATSPLRCGLSHKENRRRQRRPGADGARRSKGTLTRSQTKQPQADGGSPGRKPRTGKGDPKRSTAKPPRADGARGGYRRILEGGGSPTHGDRQSAPWREEDAQGALAFRIGYLSFGASFTSCPRLATTGMVMALAGQASTQALQRVQSASVRSP